MMKSNFADCNVASCGARSRARNSPYERLSFSIAVGGFIIIYCCVLFVFVRKVQLR